MRNWEDGRRLVEHLTEGLGDCQTEENALFTTTARMMAAFGNTQQATLNARAIVDRLKAGMKARMMAPPPMRHGVAARVIPIWLGLQSGSLAPGRPQARRSAPFG
jgi:hypothetical protein